MYPYSLLCLNFHGCLHSKSGFSFAGERVLAVRTTTVQRYVFKDSQTAGRLLARQWISQIVEAFLHKILPLSMLMKQANLLHELRVGDGIVLFYQIHYHSLRGRHLLSKGDLFFLINGGTLPIECLFNAFIFFHIDLRFIV